MKNIYLLNKISKIGLNVLPKENYQITEDLNNADAILLRSASMHEMELPKNVLAIARAGAGVNNIPYEKLAETGVLVFNTPGANANAVAELTLAGMLLATRDIYGGITWVKNNKTDADISKTTEKAKSQFGGTEILNKTIGIIGLGAIGLRLANICAGVGMKVLGTKRDLSTLANEKLHENIKLVKTKEEIFREADFISLNIPLNDHTKNTINEEVLRTLKDDVIILNFARAGLVDEEALSNSFKVRKYVTDFPTPYNANNDKFLVIPHLGASTEEAEDNCAYMAASQVKDYLENGNILNSVNYPDLSYGKVKNFRVTVMYNPSTNVKTEIIKNLNAADYKFKENKNFGYLIIDLNEKPDLSSINDLTGIIKIRELNL